MKMPTRRLGVTVVRGIAVLSIALLIVGLGLRPGMALGCVGDCNGDGMVGINELITGVNVALGSANVSACPSFDINNDGMVAINELITGVNNAQNDCGGAPTVTARNTTTATATVTSTPTVTSTGTSTNTPPTPTPAASQVPTPTSSPGSGAPFAIQAAGIYVFDTAKGVASPQILQYTTGLATGATSLSTMAAAGTGLIKLDFTADGKHAYGFDSTGSIWGYSVSATGALTLAGGGPTAPPAGIRPSILKIYESSVLWAVTSAATSTTESTTVQQYPINSDGTLGSPTAVSLTGIFHLLIIPPDQTAPTAVWTTSALSTSDSLSTLNVYPVSSGTISATPSQTLTTPSQVGPTRPHQTIVYGVGDDVGGQALYTYSVASDGTLTANPTVSLPDSTSGWFPALSIPVTLEIGGTLDLMDSEFNFLVYPASASGVVGTNLQATPLEGFPQFPFSASLDTSSGSVNSSGLPTLWIVGGEATIDEFAINPNGTIGTTPSGSVAIGSGVGPFFPGIGGYLLPSSGPFTYGVDTTSGTVYGYQIGSTGALTAEGSFVATVPSGQTLSVYVSPFEPSDYSSKPVALFVFSYDETGTNGTIVVYPLGSNGMPSSATPLDSISIPGVSTESYLVLQNGNVTVYNIRLQAF